MNPRAAPQRRNKAAWRRVAPTKRRIGGALKIATKIADASQIQSLTGKGSKLFRFAPYLGPDGIVALDLAYQNQAEEGDRERRKESILGLARDVHLPIHREFIGR